MVYMVRCSYEQKPYRKSMMQTYGAKVVASPSTRTKYGRELLKKNPKNQGSLGIAISEAIEDAVTSENTKYSLGSVLNHVLMHQTIIGLETKRQLEIAEAQPDIMIGCCGGGSNFAGFAFPFLKEKMGGKQIRFVAVEPEECPSMTRGRYAYDFGDAAQTTPLMKMHTLGHAYVPAAIHAGGLRYHGEAPLLSHVVSLGLVEPRAYEQLPVFEAAVQFARAEGIIPAPESAHAIKAAIDEAIACRKENSAKTIVFNLSGHGHFDMGAYDAFFAGKLISSKPSEAELNKAFSSIPGV
jgi:tryptophan synthase beta chain